MAACKRGLTREPRMRRMARAGVASGSHVQNPPNNQRPKTQMPLACCMTPRPGLAAARWILDAHASTLRITRAMMRFLLYTAARKPEYSGPFRFIQAEFRLSSGPFRFIQVHSGFIQVSSGLFRSIQGLFMFVQVIQGHDLNIQVRSGHSGFFRFLQVCSGLSLIHI